MTEMSRQTHEIGLLGKELLVATGICSLIRQYSPGFRVASLDLQHHRCSLLCGGGGGGVDTAVSRVFCVRTGVLWVFRVSTGLFWFVFFKSCSFYGRGAIDYDFRTICADVPIY